MSQNIIRITDLKSKIGLSRSSIFGRLNKKSSQYDPSFPKPVKLGNCENSPLGFLEAEVDQLIVSLIESSRQ